MIERFSLIRNVGRFADASDGGKAFGKRTVILGRNGSGKSTLVSILRALSAGTAEPITERHSFGATAKPQVEVMISGSPAKFAADRWSVPAVPMSVFDARFIADNVFDGESISDKTQANLHRVVLGAIGTKLAEKIQVLRVEIAEHDRALRVIQDEYQQSEHSSLSLDDFSALPVDRNIDQVITVLERELGHAKQHGLALADEIATPLTDDVSTGLYSRPHVEHEAAKEVIDEHVHKHWRTPEHPRDFLRQGFALCDEKSCSFCGQELYAAWQLMDAYRLYFTEDYEKGAAASRTSASAVVAWSIDGHWRLLDRHIAAWQPFLPDECSRLSLALENLRPIIDSTKRSLDAECVRKSERYEYTIPIDVVAAFSRAMNDLGITIWGHNETLKVYQELRKARPLEVVERELRVARARRARHTDPWEERIAEFGRIKQERQQLKDKINATVAELHDYSTRIFVQHQAQINDVLGRAGASFRIDEFSQRVDQRRTGVVSCGFMLTFFGRHRIDVVGARGMPQFSNTLSQGDKNLLAFAFFVAVLRNDDELQHCIVVVDDPLSSFDIERRLATVDILGGLENEKHAQPKQLVLLTHDISFLDAIRRSVLFEGCTFLRLSAVGKSSSGCEMSKIDHCDADSFTRPREFEWAESIEKMSGAGQELGRDAHDKCRGVLEAAFKYKYYTRLKDLIAGKQSIGTFVDRLVALGVYSEEKAKEFRSIIRWLHAPTHSGSTVAAEPSEGDVRYCLQETARVLELV